MVKRLSAGVIAVLFILLITVGFASAITGAIGNAKMVLYPEVNGFTYTKIEKSILTKNVNDVPINISLQVDNETAKFIELIDETFILEPHTEKRAEFIVKVKDEGTYKGKIAVFFSPVDGDKKAGVALSSEIIVIAKKDQGYSGTNEDNIRDEEEQNTDTTTGDIVADSESGKKSPALTLGLLAGSVFVLLLILAALIIVLKKGKKGGKRRNKVNGRRKK